MTPRSPKKPVERTIPTRNHPLTTSGSGHQNPVAPNNMENYDNSSMADTASTTRCEEASLNRQQRESSAARIAPAHGQDSTQLMPSMISIQDLRQIIRALKAPAPPQPEFSGLSHEDPRAFIKECEAYFEKSGADPAHWTRIAGKSLLDEAAKWWSPYKSFSLPWEQFKELFQNKYASQTVENGLRVSLYSRKQAEKEPTAIFLQKKYLLAKRLCPQNTEEELIGTILETLRPSIKRVIRAADPRTFAELMDRATQAEADEIEGQSTRVKEENTRKPTPNNLQEARLPACHYCPQRHFHRDCPVLAQRSAMPPEHARNTGSNPAENWRRAAAENTHTRNQDTSANQQ